MKSVRRPGMQSCVPGCCASRGAAWECVREARSRRRANDSSPGPAVADPGPLSRHFDSELVVEPALVLVEDILTERCQPGCRGNSQVTESVRPTCHQPEQVLVA